MRYENVNFMGSASLFDDLYVWSGVWQSMGFSAIIYTCLGTLMNMVTTICVAYPLSFKDFVGKKFCMLYFMITMYFAGGIVTSYLLPLQNVVRKVYNSVVALAENMASGAGSAQSTEVLKQQQESAEILNGGNVINNGCNEHD